jgi:glycosyltransferase involved in cell wall biosynthesis
VKILFANALYGGGGGAESYIHSVIPALVSRGHDVALVHELTSPHAIPAEDASPEIERWCIEEDGLAEVSRRIRRWAPDVVYQHGVFSSTLELELISTTPAVLYAHSYYGACATGTKRYAFPAFQPCTRTIGPACLALHYPRRCGGLNPATTLREFKKQMGRRALLNRYRFVLVASRHMLAEYTRQLDSSSHVRLVPLPPAGLEPVTNRPVGRQRTGRILFAARLTQLKGGHHLIDAMRGAEEGFDPSLHLTVLGSGPERDALERQARTLGVRAEFTGWVRAAERNRLLATSDLVAVPSLWPEPFGLIGIEAGCLGVPAVGYDVGGIAEWLRPSMSGELAPANPPTPAGLAAAIRRALESSEHYEQLCAGAWEVAKSHGMSGHLDALEEVLEEAAADNKKRGAKSEDRGARDSCG